MYQARAQMLAYNKVSIGEECKICGSTNRLHRHHKDYNKPLEIITVCSKCHSKIHNFRYIHQMREYLSQYLIRRMIRRKMKELYFNGHVKKDVLKKHKIYF